MEPIVLFATLVFGVCALDLIWKLSAYVHRITPKKRRVDLERQPVQRSDWHLFFHCSDLTGEKTTKTRNPRLGKHMGPALKTARQPAFHRPEMRRYMS